MRGRNAAIALVTVAALVTAWTVWSPSRRTAASAPTRGVPSGRSAEPAATIFDVHDERLQRSPARTPEPPSSRNPFRFRASEASPPSAAVPRGARPPVLVVPAGPPAPAELREPFSLSGIAERTTEEGSTRIAVLSAPRALFHVPQGGVVLGRYRVTAITATSVTMVDLETGRTFDLVLKTR